MAENNTRFDPTIVAQFFRTLEEFRAGNADFQRSLLATVNDLREDIKELRKEIQDVRQQLADGNRTFGVLEQQLLAHTAWERRKEEECKRHQQETGALREEAIGMREWLRESNRQRQEIDALRGMVKILQDEMLELRAAGTGISLMWKVIIGAVGLLVSVGGLIALLR